MNKYISVIVPVYNEQEHIISLLSDLRSQSFDLEKFEVIIVDNNSDDYTAERVARFAYDNPQLSLILAEEGLPHVSAARNRGAMMAQGEVLLFLDGDNRIGSKLLEEVYRSACEEGYQAGTIFTLDDGSSRMGHLVFLLLEIIKVIVPRPFGKSFCRKTLFNTVGGYDVNVSLGTNLSFLSKVKRHLKQNSKKMAHIVEPVYASLRRFETEGYIVVLLRWLLAYLGLKRIPYSQKYKTVNASSDLTSFDDNIMIQDISTPRKQTS